MLEQDYCLSNICIKTVVLFECVVIISLYCIKILGNICKPDSIFPSLFLLLGLFSGWSLAFLATFVILLHFYGAKSSDPKLQNYAKVVYPIYRSKTMQKNSSKYCVFIL